MEALGEPRTRTTTEGEAKVGHIGTLTVGAASADRSEGGEALGEDGTRARGDTTDEATDMEREGDSLSGTGAISEVAPVAAVNTGRAMATNRTDSGAPSRADSEDDAPIADSDVVNMQASKMGKQLRETHGQYAVSEARHRGTHRLMFYRFISPPAPPEVRQSPFSMRECAMLQPRMPYDMIAILR